MVMAQWRAHKYPTTEASDTETDTDKLFLGTGTFMYLIDIRTAHYNSISPLTYDN